MTMPGVIAAPADDRAPAEADTPPKMPLQADVRDSHWNEATVVEASSYHDDDPAASTAELALYSAEIGRYTVLRKLGAGGMGVVYAAYDEQLDRKVALKLVHPTNASDARASLRMRREAQAMAKLSHPNVVPVFDVGEFQGLLFIAMEFVQGQTLDEWLILGDSDDNDADALMDGESGAESNSARKKTTGSKSQRSTDPLERDSSYRSETLSQSLSSGIPAYLDSSHSVASASARNMVTSESSRRRTTERNAVTGESSRSRRGINERSGRTTERSGFLSGSSRLLTGRREDVDLRPSHRDRSWRDVLAVHRQAGAGLAAAHCAGLVHRDYKPSNVLVCGQGRAHVLDFGLVRQEHQAATESALTVAPMPSDFPQQDSLTETLTIDGAIMGTPAYMSPEQFSNGPIDARSDQFSFCVTLFEALYGINPFRGPTMGSRMLRIMNNAVADPIEPHDVPDWLHDILLRGLRYAPDERWPSMDDLLVALAGDPETEVDTDTAIRVSRGSLIGGTLAFAVTAVLVWILQKYVNLEEATSSPVGALVVSILVAFVYVGVVFAGRRTLMRTRVSRQIVGCGAITCLGVIGTRLIPVFYEVPFEYGFLYGQLVIGCVIAVGAVAILRPLIWIAMVWLLLIPITIWQLEYAPALQSIGVLITCALGFRYWRQR